MTKLRIYIDGSLFLEEIGTKHNIWWIDVESLLRKSLVSELGPNIEIEKICFFSVKRPGKYRNNQETHEKAMQAQSPCIEVIYGKRFAETDFGILEDEELDVSKLATIRTDENQDTNINIAHRIIKDTLTNESKKFDVACFYNLQFDLDFIRKFKDNFYEEYEVIIPTFDVV